jgi:cell division protein ZapA
MATIDIEIAGRRYDISCADGEEDHLRSVAALVDRRARDATQALGSLTEARHLLYAALMLADDLKDARAGAGVSEPEPDTAVAEAIESLAEQVESLAERMEARAHA